MIRPVVLFLIFLLGSGAGWFAHEVWSRQQAAAESADVRVDLSIRQNDLYYVQKVMDGDTILLENGLTVRYRGINTPEKGKFISDPAPLAYEATNRNRELVENKWVRLEMDESSIDRYGRILARVFVEDKKGRADSEISNRNSIDVEKILLEEGLARVMGIGLPAEESEKLKSYEALAKEKKVGVWGVQKPLGENRQNFCAAVKSKLFHSVHCKTANIISPANYLEYPTVEKAKEAGRKPCPKCLP